MRAIVLGSAAGGGFPQWNCGCRNCVSVRAGAPGLRARTQDSLIVEATAARDRFVLVNTSPDVLAQIKSTPALWPRAPRHSPIAAIVLTNGDLDHVLGLFSLRESYPLALYATEAVWRGLEESVFLRTMRRFEGQLVKHVLPIGRETQLADAGGEALGVRIEALPMRGKLPVHLDGRTASAEDNVALRIDDGSGPSLVYAAAFASLEGADFARDTVVMLDGTFFTEDELVQQGLSKAVAKDMAHLPVSLSMAALRHLAARKIYTHVNNTNPMLDETSTEHRRVLEAGFEIAHDGMEVTW